MPLFRIPLSDLRPHVYPLDGQMWRCGPLDATEVEAARQSGSQELRQWNDVVNTLGLHDSREFHVRRIATLIDQPSADHIVVIVENHTLPVRVYLNDGNHRLAAAYLRGDPSIDAVVAISVPGSELSVFPNARAL